MKDIDLLAGMLVASLLACLAVGGAASHSRAQTNPQVVPSKAREGVSYCPTRAFGQPQTYYPCMYSSREFSA